MENNDFDNILLDEKLYENILIYNISYKTLISVNPLHIILDRIDGFSRKFDGTRYLILLGPEKYDAIYNSIRYLLSLKSCITYSFSHNYGKMKINSYDSLHSEKLLTFYNVIILLKSVFNKAQNHYYYNILLIKCSYQLAKK